MYRHVHIGSAERLRDMAQASIPRTEHDTKYMVASTAKAPRRSRGQRRFLLMYGLDVYHWLLSQKSLQIDRVAEVESISIPT